MLRESIHRSLLALALMLLLGAAASAQTGTVSGTVTPVVGGTRVTVRNTRGSEFEVVAADPSTGDYVVSGLSDGNYEVTANAPGYVVQIAAVTIEYGAPVEQDFTLQLGGTISGSLTPAGVEARVRATDQTTGLAFEVAPVGGGFQIAQMPAGTYQLCVVPESAYLTPSCETDVVVTAGQESSGHVFTLQLGGIIVGQVTPIPTGGLVFACPTSDMSSCVGLGAINPATGAYTVVGLPGGTYHLAFMANGYIRDVGTDTGYASSTLTTQDVADITSVINAWAQAYRDMSSDDVLSLLTDSYTDMHAGVGKTQLGSILSAEFAAMQSISVACSVDIVKGVSGVSAAAIIQVNRTYTPTSGSPYSRRLEALLNLTKASGSWLISSANPWQLNYVYEPLQGETTPIIVGYKQDSAISNISVTVGQATQVSTWTLTPAQ